MGKLFPGLGALLSPIVAQSQSRGPVVNRIPTEPGEIQQRRVTFPEVRGGWGALWEPGRGRLC